LAGLCAARDLTAAGKSVAVLEARDRVGGRLLNEEIGAGEIVEVGGQWVGPTQARVLALARELGLETFATYGEGENVIEHRGELRRYSGTIPPFSPAVMLDVGQAQWRLNRMALHLLFYVHSAGSLELLFDTEGGAQQDRIVGGTQLFALRLAERLGDSVVQEAPVRRIAHGDDGVTVEADGTTVRARRAIVAIAPALAGRIAYDPPLPGYRDQLTQRMPLGTVAKCMTIYDEPFWRRDGLSGQGLTTQGPVKLTYDNSPPSGSPGVLLGFLEGRHARELGRLAPERRRELVLDCFSRLFGARAASPDRYVERLWAEEEWTRGCYGCHMPPGAWTAYGPALRAPIGPLHWASSETATVWSGYMDGAVSSGQRAASEVLAAV
jgi:monoamine oxidase